MNTTPGPTERAMVDTSMTVLMELGRRIALSREMSPDMDSDDDTGSTDGHDAPGGSGDDLQRDTEVPEMEGSTSDDALYELLAGLHSPENFAIDEGLGPLAVEASFPSSARIILWDRDADSLRRGLEELESGAIFQREDEARSLVTGSRADGLAMEWMWGYTDTDTDFMLLRGGGWGVHFDDNVTSTVRDRLVLHVGQSSPAYGLLRADGDLARLAERMGKATVGPIIAPIGRDAAATCFEKRNGQYWLSSQKAASALRQGDFNLGCKMCGPAQSYDAGFELINGFVCPGPHPDLSAYIDRIRESDWPPAELLQQIARQPAILVAVGHHLSLDADIEFRLSWSFVEILLSQSLPEWVKQGYRAFKYVMKVALSKARLADEQRAGTGWEARGQTAGRSVLGSYHLKTTLFWLLEEAEAWRHHCPYRLFILLLERFEAVITPTEESIVTNNADVTSNSCQRDSLVGSRKIDIHPNRKPQLPHYLLPACDLLQCVSDSELCRGRQCILNIRGDPVAALLLAPIDPRRLYGAPTETGDLEFEDSDRRRTVLVTALRAQSQHVTEGSMVRQHQALRSLLCRLDDYRAQHLEWQLRRDESESPPASGRPTTMRSLLKIWEESSSSLTETKL